MNNLDPSGLATVFIGQHAQWRLIESFALAICRFVLLEPAPSEQRARVDQVEARVRKPDALSGLAVPAIRMSRDSAWQSARERRCIQAGVMMDVLEESPGSAAYRVQLAPGVRWELPEDSAALVLAGAVATPQLGPGDRLPQGGNIALLAGPVGVALLLAGRRYRLSSL